MPLDEMKCHLSGTVDCSVWFMDIRIYISNRILGFILAYLAIFSPVFILFSATDSQFSFVESAVENCCDCM